MLCYLSLLHIQSIRDAIASADAAAFRLVNHGLGCAWLDPLMLVITWFGLGAVQAAVGLVLFGGSFAKRNVELRRIGFAALLAYSVSGILVQVTKHLWDRPRPPLVLYDVRVPYGPLFTHSFPSGHSMTAFAAAFAYAAFLPRARWPLIGLASLVAVSRVYLGVHFPLDVLYGAFAGALIGIGSARLVRSRMASSPQPSQSGAEGPYPSPPHIGEGVSEPAE